MSRPHAASAYTTQDDGKADPRGAATELLGVGGGKLTEFKSLNARAIQPAVAEVNAISPWSVVILPVKDGKKVTAVMYGWSVKDTPGPKRQHMPNCNAIGLAESIALTERLSRLQTMKDRTTGIALALSKLV